MKKKLLIFLLGGLLLCFCGCSSKHVCANCGENKKCDEISFFKDGKGFVEKDWICSIECRNAFSVKNHFSMSTKGLN